MITKQLFYDWSGINLNIFYFINHLFISTPDIDKFMVGYCFLGTTHGLPITFLLVFLLAISCIYYDKITNPLYLLKNNLLKWGESVSVIIGGLLFLKLIVPYVKSYFAFKRPLCSLPEGKVHILLEYNYTLEQATQYYCHQDNSFPSAHSMIACIFACGLWPRANIYGKIILVAMVLMMGISRIALGVHFPADVFYGCLFGLLLAMLSRRLLQLVWVKPAV